MANNYLRLLTDKPFIIDVVNGCEILADADDVFTWIDKDFKKWRVDEQGPATDRIPVIVYEMTKDGTFADLYGSLCRDNRKLCFTQAQIKSFVKKYRSWLQTDGYGALFLLQSRGEFFVARVRAHSNGFHVEVHRFEHAALWYVVNRLRLVVPQITL
ncbi:MAG: hypothetical protein V1867_03650 [Candidatus Falkowbacteria bacterium]